jgi:hypothetical protein
MNHLNNAVLKATLAALCFIASIFVSFFLASGITYHINKNNNSITPITNNTQNLKPDNTSAKNTAIKELDLKLFAPFYFWLKKDGHTLELAKYDKEGETEKYASITATSEDGTFDRSHMHGYSDLVVSNDFNKLGAELIEKYGDVYSFSVVIFNPYSDHRDIYKQDLGNTSSNIDLHQDAWSPNDKYFYYLISSDDENNHNYWVINTDTKRITKILNGYNYRIIGWASNSLLAYYDISDHEKNKLTISAVDVTDGSIKTLGYCDNLWFNRCLTSGAWFPDENKFYYFNINESNVSVYNYVEHTSIKLFDILADTEFVSAQNDGFSPNRNFLLINLEKYYTNTQPPLTGLYEYYITNDSWRHISRNRYSAVLWNKTSDRYVLLKEFNKPNFFMHPTDSYDIYPVKLPAYIYDFVSY